jgi:hypothetical protein
MIEFNNEMTFRDFSKNEIKETDKLSEHNMSILSNGDLENINDITIVLTDGRKSEVFRDTIAASILAEKTKEEFSTFQKSNEQGSEYKLNNDNKIKPKLYSFSGMDEFLTKTYDINNIKI